MCEKVNKTEQVIERARESILAIFIITITIRINIFFWCFLNVFFSPSLFSIIHSIRIFYSLFYFWRFFFTFLITQNTRLRFTYNCVDNNVLLDENGEKGEPPPPPPLPSPHVHDWFIKTHSYLIWFHFFFEWKKN